MKHSARASQRAPCSVFLTSLTKQKLRSTYSVSSVREMNIPRMRAKSCLNGRGSSSRCKVAHHILAHLYEHRHVLDVVEILERNLQPGLFGCCHCRAIPSVACLASSPQSAWDGRRRDEREGALSLGVVAMWRVSLARGRTAMGVPIRCRCPRRAAFRLARLF